MDSMAAAPFHTRKIGSSVGSARGQIGNGVK